MGYVTSGLLFTRYCFRGYHPTRKIFFGFLLVYWSEHIYHLSSMFGILLNLKGFL